MRHLRLGLAAVSLVFLAGCGEGSGIGTGVSGPTQPYQDITGVYSGPVTSAGSGLLLTGTIVLALTQTDSTFAGSYAITGTLDDGATVNAVNLLGTVANGTLKRGTNPDVELDFSPSGCPATFVHNSGTFVNDLLRITLLPAEIPVPPAGCAGAIPIVSDTLIVVGT